MTDVLIAVLLLLGERLTAAVVLTLLILAAIATLGHQVKARSRSSRRGRPPASTPRLPRGMMGR